MEQSDEHDVIGSRVIMQNKYDLNECLERRKDKVVVRRLAQRPEVNFTEHFSHVACISSIRTIIAIAVECEMELEQIDITSAQNTLRCFDVSD